MSTEMSAPACQGRWGVGGERVWEEEEKQQLLTWVFLHLSSAYSTGGFWSDAAVAFYGRRGGVVWSESDGSLMDSSSIPSAAFLPASSCLIDLCLWLLLKMKREKCARLGVWYHAYGYGRKHIKGTGRIHQVHKKNSVCGNSGKVVVSVLVMELVEYNFL